MRRSSPACVLLFAISLLAAQSASAIVLVGPTPHKLDGSGCPFQSIQAAINYVLDKERRATPDVDPYIGVAGGSVYNEALNLDGSDINSYNVFGTPYDHPFVQIYGDYDQACGNTQDGSVAQISGANKGGSVLFIHGNRTVEVILNHLELLNANNTTGNATGGGINFTGQGILDTTNVTIRNNTATDGGGLFADGLGAVLTLKLRAGTIIDGNHARGGGGGMSVSGIVDLTQVESLLVENNIAAAKIAKTIKRFGMLLQSTSMTASLGCKGGQPSLDGAFRRSG
jgi:hypothetical protein